MIQQFEKIVIINHKKLYNVQIFFRKPGIKKTLYEVKEIIDNFTFVSSYPYLYHKYIKSGVVVQNYIICMQFLLFHVYVDHKIRLFYLF